MRCYHWCSYVIRRNVRTHVAETVNSSLWWRVALPKVDGRVGVVSTWLLNACGGSSIGALVHGRLHLFEELINVH
jgi:hypothetical protein